MVKFPLYTILACLLNSNWTNVPSPQRFRASFSAWKQSIWSVQVVLYQTLCATLATTTRGCFILLPLWQPYRRPQDHISQCISRLTSLSQGSSSEELSYALPDELSSHGLQFSHMSSHNSRIYKLLHWKWVAPATNRTQASSTARKEAYVKGKGQNNSRI